MSENDFSLDGYDDFPEVRSLNNEVRELDKAEVKAFTNVLHPNDSLTTCGGFINEIRPKDISGKRFYFVRVGIVQGSRQGTDNNWIGDITNCDLLVGMTLKKWVESVINLKDPLPGIKVSMAIRNLKFIPEIYDSKPVLKTRGILEKITIGYLNE